VHDCWQLDATEWRLADGRTVVIFQLEDDHSRYIVGSHVAWSENSAAAVAVMSAAVAAHQAPVLLLTDNGIAMNPHRRGLISQLAAYAAGLGIRAITSRIYHPQTAGKNERLHQTLKLWLRARPLPVDIDQLTGWLQLFDRHYNHRRPHQSLQARTPAQGPGELPAGPAAQPCPTIRPARAHLDQPDTNLGPPPSPTAGRPAQPRPGERQRVQGSGDQVEGLERGLLGREVALGGHRSTAWRRTGTCPGSGG
jgi:hypothetical protein